MIILQLWQHISKIRRYQFLFLFFLILVASIAEVISIWAVIPFLGILIGSKNVGELLPIKFEGFVNLSLLPPFDVTILFCIAVSVSGALRLFAIWFQTRLSHAVGMDFSCEIYRKTLYQPYSVHTNRNSSEVITGMMTKTNDVVQLVIFPLLSLASSTVLLIAILGALLLINTKIALFLLIGLCLIYSGIMLLTKGRLKANSYKINFNSSAVVKLIQESLGGIRDLIINGSQEVFISRHASLDSKLRLAQAQNQIMASAPRFIIETLGVILIAFIAYTMITSAASFSIVPILGALVLGAQRLLPVIQQAYSSWSNIKGAKGVLADVIILLNQPLPIFRRNSEAIALNKKIILDNISFKYGESSRFAITSINLVIPKGSQVGIIGSTGGGKSTFLDILMGLISPSCGSLVIDDVVISEDNISEWRSSVSHVPQAIFLTDGTVSENIALGIPINMINMDKVKNAAMVAQIDNDIQSWPLGYETIIGERGIRLSGGQRQRLGIARSLYKDSTLIILDEATSALDMETEAMVIKAIQSNPKGAPTLVMAAHRLQTLKNCSLIIRIEDGKIVCSGSYKEVIGD